MELNSNVDSQIQATKADGCLHVINRLTSNLFTVHTSGIIKCTEQKVNN